MRLCVIGVADHVNARVSKPSFSRVGLKWIFQGPSPVPFSNIYHQS